MINELSKIVEDACKNEKNFFGYGIWSHHILLVVKYARLLAQKFCADEDILEVAALLHDYASIKDYKMYEDHHIHGAEEAEKILKRFNYPTQKIEQVKQCIISHRGSKVLQKQTKEAIFLADADAMSHFDSIPALFNFAFQRRKMNIDEASSWVLGKLERSWNKLSPVAQEIVKDKYEASKLLLNS